MKTVIVRYEGEMVLTGGERAAFDPNNAPLFFQPGLDLDRFIARLDAQGLKYEVLDGTAERQRRMDSLMLALAKTGRSSMTAPSDPSAKYGAH